MIEIETQYTYKTYKEFYWFSIFRGKYFRYGRKVFSVVTVLMPVLTVISFLLLDSISALIAGCVGTAAVILLYALGYFSTRHYVAKSPAMFQSSMRFLFNDEELCTEQAGAMVKGTGATKYGALYKAYETKDVFYVYISPNQAYILAKNDFVKGTPEELRALLQNQLKKKFIVCK